MLYVPDMDEYLKNDKNFFMNLETLPFLLAKNNDELISSINEFDSEKYSEEILSFNKKYNSWEAGTASYQSVEWLLEKMN